MRTTFGKLKEGQRFKTQYSKRLMTCVKVGLTDVIIEGMIHLRNAVILLDHAGQPASDLGTLITVEDSTEVETVN